MTRESLRRQLRINGRPVQTMCNQMLIDLTDFDFGVPLPTPPQYPKKKRELQKCVCGAEAIGVKKFMAGHSDWCEVHEDKTPITR